MCLDLVRFGKIWLDLIGFCEIPADLVRFRILVAYYTILRTGANFCRLTVAMPANRSTGLTNELVNQQMLPNLIKSDQIHPVGFGGAPRTLQGNPGGPTPANRLTGLTGPNR